MGGIFGSKQKSATTTVKQNADPWSGVQPYLQNQFAAAQNLYNQSPQGFSTNPDYYLAPQSPYTTQAYGMVANQATAGSPALKAQGQYLTDQISGKYLDPNTNPYLAGAVNDALGQARSAFNSQYGGAAGANVNNSGFQEGLARTLGNVATNAYSNAYNQGLGYQANAAAMAPNNAAAQYLDANMLQNIGQQQQGYWQAQLGALQQAYQSPFKALQQYQGGITGQYPTTGGTSQQSSNPYFTNPAASALGMGIGGLSLYNGLNSAGVFGGLGNLFGGGGLGYGTIGTEAASAMVPDGFGGLVAAL